MGVSFGSELIGKVYELNFVNWFFRVNWSISFFSFNFRVVWGQNIKEFGLEKTRKNGAKAEK